MDTQQIILKETQEVFPFNGAFGEPSQADQPLETEVLYKSEQFSTAIIRLSERAEVTEHISKAKSCVQVLQGEAELIADGQSLRLREGSHVVIQANVSHRIRANDNCVLLLCLNHLLPPDAYRALRRGGTEGGSGLMRS